MSGVGPNACSKAGVVSARCVLAQSNPIVVENAKPGNPPSQWDISGSGDPSIQGFATDISVNRGQTIRFKVKTNATNYRLDIYRLGYYGGSGARLVAGNVLPTASLPQNQPNPITDSSTGLIDCEIGLNPHPGRFLQARPPAFTPPN
jgi:hypothetical protein